ncbi:MAG: APC family permease, partial [Candidatus Hodarchaeales archaeon]
MPEDTVRSGLNNSGNITGIVTEVTLARELNWKDGLMIGIGGMIGAGVFSVLGLSTSIAGPSVILSFIFGGFMALLTGFSYSKLAVLFPRAGGSYIFVDNAFKKTWLSGLVGWVLWTAYIIACALYAFTFGAYFTGMLVELLSPFVDIQPFAFFLKKILTIILIIFFLNLNLKGVKETTSLQNKIVITKVVILVFFVIVGIMGISRIGLVNLIGNETSPDWSIFFPSGTFAFVIAATLIFIAYEGFELILNAADEMVDPKIDVPKAIYISVLVVWVIYV